MVESKYITATDGRLKQALTRMVSNSSSNMIRTVVKEEIEKNKILKGTVVKYYPYTDRVLVRLDSNGEEVICQILHFTCANMRTSFIPMGEAETCTEEAEKCIIPTGTINAIVTNLSDISTEYVLLGYYYPSIDDLDSYEDGDLVFTNTGGSDTDFIRFGFDGLHIKTSKIIIEETEGVKKGLFDSEFKNNLQKDVYTKKEVNKLLNDMKEDIIKELIDK